MVGESRKARLFLFTAMIARTTTFRYATNVAGDLLGYRNMIALQMKISKNEAASHDQSHGYKKYDDYGYGDYD